VFLIPADGSQQDAQPLKVNGTSRFPSWSSPGKIAFDNGDPSSGDIYVVNPDGSGLQRLTFHPEWRNIRPAWSPDGQKIAFVSHPDGSDDRIFVMNADGSGVTQLTSVTKPIADNAPAWSPNGQKIVFQRNLGVGNGKTEIYTMNADGTDQTRLTNYPGRDQDPDWSPDGRTIAFERDADIANQTLQVFVMNADGSNLRQLTGLDFPGDPSENNHPGWGPGHLGEPWAALISPTRGREAAESTSRLPSLHRASSPMDAPNREQRADDWRKHWRAAHAAERCFGLPSIASLACVR
jgi:TolB protein